MIKKNLQNKFVWTGISKLLVVISVFVYANVTNSATVDKPAFPTIKIATVPETIQPGEETSLTLEQEGFTGEYLFTNWCIDGVPLNSFYAGSDDQITMEDVVADVPVYNESNVQTGIVENSVVQVPVIKNEWGQQIGGNGYCNFPLRPLNPEIQNLNWWNKSNLINIDIDTYPALFNKKVNDILDKDADTIIPRAVRATIVGVESVPGDPLDPTFLDTQVLGEYQPDFDFVTDSGVPYKHSADIKGLDMFLKNMLGVDELPTDDVYYEGSPFSIVEEDRFENTDAINDKIIIDLRYPSAPTYLYIKSDSLEKESYLEAIEEEEYRIEGTPEDVDGYTRYNLKESYRFDLLTNIATVEKDATDAGKTIETFYHLGYNFPILKRVEDGDIKTTTADAPFGYRNYVKSRVYTPIKANVLPGGYQTYIERIFTELGARFDNTWLGGNVENTGYAYQLIFERFLNNTYYANRSMYFNRKYSTDPELQKDAAQNVVQLSRAFNFMDLEDTRPEGRVYSDDVDPDTGLQSAYRYLPSYKDRDKDGMPDLWEMKYFGDYAGKIIKKPSKPKKKERVWFPGCCSTEVLDQEADLLQFLFSVSPTDDWDGDGFDRTNRAYQEWVNEFKGRYKTTTSRGLGPIIERNTYGGLSSPGNKKLSNFKEFVMGTSPIESDTDKDGVPDELDFYGLGQNTLKVKLQKDDPEANYNITARAYGPTNRGNYEGSGHFARADATTALKQGGDLPIEIALTISPDPVTIADSITISSSVGNIEDMDPTLLFFQWYLNDTPIQYPDEEKPGQACPCTEKQLEYARFLGEQSGLGKTTLTFPASLATSQACDAIDVKLEVTNLKTNQTATTSTQVPMRMQGVIIKSIKGNAPDALYGLGENLGISKIDPEAEAVSSVDEGGVREDDVLELTAALVGYAEDTCGYAPVEPSYDTTSGALDEQSTIDLENLTPEQAYMNSLTYIWTIDGIQSKIESGMGKRTIDFKPTSLPRTSPTNRETADAASEADDHDIRVEIYDWDQNLISFAEDGVKVLGPYIDFNLTGPGIVKEPTNKAGDRTDTVLRSSNVILRADGQYLQPGDSYTFTVTRNGEIVVEPTQVASPIIEYSYIAGETDNAQGFEDFVVNIVSKTADGHQIQDISESFSVQVIDALEEANTLSTGFIGRFIPKSFKGIINVFAGISTIAIIYVFAYGYSGSRVGKK